MAGVILWPKRQASCCRFHPDPATSPICLMTASLHSVPPIFPGREQPCSEAAEKAALGGIFIKPGAFDEVATTLESDDFFFPVHRVVFEAMLALDERRQPLDIISVSDEI